MTAAARVLVVDDDLPICEVVELTLADEGWDVRTQTHCQEALALLQRWAADVILLDLSLPDMDVETFLALCCQQTEEAIPVILLSASPNLEHHAARLGVNGMLAKPFDLDDLCRTVRQVI